MLRRTFSAVAQAHAAPEISQSAHSYDSLRMTRPKHWRRDVITPVTPYLYYLQQNYNKGSKELGKKFIAESSRRWETMPEADKILFYERAQKYNEKLGYSASLRTIQPDAANRTDQNYRNIASPVSIDDFQLALQNWSQLDSKGKLKFYKSAEQLQLPDFRLCAYNAFFTQKTYEFSSELSSKTMLERFEFIGSMWRRLPDAQKDSYNAVAQKMNFQGPSVPRKALSDLLGTFIKMTYPSLREKFPFVNHFEIISHLFTFWATVPLKKRQLSLFVTTSLKRMDTTVKFQLGFRSFINQCMPILTQNTPNWNNFNRMQLLSSGWSRMRVHEKEIFIVEGLLRRWDKSNVDLGSAHSAFDGFCAHFYLFFLEQIEKIDREHGDLPLVQKYCLLDLRWRERVQSSGLENMLQLKANDEVNIAQYATQNEKLFSGHSLSQPKLKRPPNPFAVYMASQKEHIGHRKDFMIECSKSWRALSEDEKDIYRQEYKDLQEKQLIHETQLAPSFVSALESVLVVKETGKPHMFDTHDLSALYLFYADEQAKSNRNGDNLIRSVCERWQKMPHDEMEEYRQKAKDHKIQEPASINHENSSRNSAYTDYIKGFTQQELSNIESVNDVADLPSRVRSTEGAKFIAAHRAYKTMPFEERQKYTEIGRQLRDAENNEQQQKLVRMFMSIAQSSSRNSESSSQKRAVGGSHTFCNIMRFPSVFRIFCYYRLKQEESKLDSTLDIETLLLEIDEEWKRAMRNVCMTRQISETAEHVHAFDGTKVSATG